MLSTRKRGVFIAEGLALCLRFAWSCIVGSLCCAQSLQALDILAFRTNKGLMDDFFADLLPTKQSDDAAKAGSNSSASFQDDAVLPSKLESPKSTVSQSSLDLMSGDSQKAQTSAAQQPMGEPKMRRELKEYQQVTQAVVEGALKRFSGDLQRVLEDISRCVLYWPVHLL